MIGLDSNWDYLLDPQQAPVRGFCLSCGRELYAKNTTLCRRCSETEQQEEEA